MADIQSNIQVNVDTSGALAQLKALQRQISTFHTSLAKSTATAARAQQELQDNLINSINATGKFAASMRTIKSSTESFTESLEKNKFSTREYFRYAGAATKTFGKLFKSEFDTISKVAEERVKTMQTQYIKMGRGANGALQSIAVRPLTLDMEDLSTKIALASQKQQLFGQLLKQGSTNLLNFGKNTQWAGRQLMVGFTIPLTIFGTKASQVFMDLEKQAIRFKRVYGEMFTTTAETNKALEDIRLLAQEFTKYGVAVVDTMKMAADAAATGKMGADLLAQVAQATRLAVLGSVEQDQALETTISLTNAFGIAADDLANKINFLNAVENQTVVSIEDLTVAIPKAGPVVQQLGGNVEDLAFFLTAMKEGGINASEGANALKSGLASLINPTDKASGMLQDLGINIQGIVNANKGNVKGIVVDFANALDRLAPLDRAKAIEQLFGKFQFSRLSTLFQNVTKDGTQAARVLQLTGASVEELAVLSERELAAVEDATGTKFKKSMENLKQSLAPVGEQFLKAVTPIVEFIGKILEKFNNLGDGGKRIAVILATVVGAIGPVFLMTFGLIANGAANIIKLFGTMRNGFLGLGKQSDQLAFQTQYMSSEQMEAAAIASSLDQAHARLIQTFTQEANALDALNNAYRRAISAGQNFANANPGAMLPPIRGGKTPGGLILPGYAKGKGVQIVPGNGPGNKDTELAMLAPGEAVISAPLTKKYGPLINSMIADNIPGYKTSRHPLSPVTREKINQVAPFSQDDKGKITTGNVRVPVGGRQFVYSTAGILAPGEVNKAPGGMTQEYLQSAMGRDAMLANVEVELQTLKNGTERTASILEEIAPILNRAIDSWSGNINAWQQAAEEATREINELQTLTQQEKDAIRRRIAPTQNEYGVQSNRVYQIKPGESPTSRDERSTSAYRAEQQKRILAAKGYDIDGLVYAHMPGFEKIEKEKVSPVKTPTFSNVDPSQYTQEQKKVLQQVQNEIHEYLVSVGDLKQETYETYLAQQKLTNEVNELSTEVSKETQQLRMSNPSTGSNTLILPNEPGFTRTGRIRTKLAKGIKKVPGTGSKDNFPAMLAPGEAVIPADMTKKYQPIINGMVAGSIPGFAEGWTGNPGSWRDSSGMTEDPFANVGVPIEPESVRRSGQTIGDMFSKVAKGAANAIGSAIVAPMSKQIEQDMAEVDAEHNAKMRSMASKFSQTNQTPIQEDPYANIGVIPADDTSDKRSGRFARATGAFRSGGLLRGGGRGRVAGATVDPQMAAAQLEQQRRFMQRTNGAMIAMNGLTQAASMMGNGIQDKIAPMMMGMNMLTMGMQMVTGPKSALALAAVAVGGTYYALKKQNEALLKKTIETTVAMGAGTKSMRDLAKATGKVSAGEIMDRRRAAKMSQFQIQTGKKTFGQSFVEGEQGKKMIEQFGQRMKDLGPGGQQVAQSEMVSQLATAISSGIMTPAQARSVAANIGEAMGDRSFGINVNAQLIELMGVNGENLLKDPVAVRVKLIEDAKSNVGRAADAANKSGRLTAGQAGRAGLFGIGGAAGGAVAGLMVGGSVAAGMAAAGATAGSVVPVIGTAIGAVAGLAIGAMIGLKKRNQAIAKATGASVAMQQIALEQSQELLDSYDVENQKKIQLLETDGKLAEAAKARAEYEEGRLKILAQNASLNTQILNSYKNATGKGVRDKLLFGSEQAAVAKYKGTPMEAIAGGAVEGIKSLGLNKEQQYLLNIQLSSGQLQPTQVMDLVSLFQGDKAGAAKFVDITTRFGATMGNEAMGVASMFVDRTGKPLDNVQKTLIANVAAGKTPAEAQKLIDFYNALGKTGTVLDMEVVGNFLINNPNTASILQGVISDIQNQKGKINLTLATKLLGATPATLESLNSNLDYFTKLPAEQQKVYLTTLVTATETFDANSQDTKNFMKERGLSYKGTPQAGRGKFLPDMQVTKEYVNQAKGNFQAEQVTKAAKEAAAKAGKDGKTGDGDKRDTTFDDLLKRLKLVQNSSINALGGLKELKKVMSGSGAISLTKFQGIDQQLLSKGKVSQEFLDFVDSLGPEGLQKDLKNFVKIGKDGLMTLNEAGKAIMRGMVAAKLGEYQVNIKNTILSLNQQTQATSKLIKAGFTFAEAQELAKDQTLALAIANNELSPKQLKELKKQTRELTNAQKEYERVTKIALMDEMDGQKTRFEMVQKYVALQEQLIENQYASEKAVLNSRQAANEYALGKISQEEDAINKKYDKEIEALDKVAAKQEEINQIQQRRFSLAQALAGGDMAGAAGAIQEIRQAEALAQIERRRKSIEEARNKQLAGVQFNGKTREQIEADNKAIVNSLADIEEKIRLAKNALDDELKKTIGMTRVEIQAAVSGISAALDAGVDPNNKKFLGQILKGVVGDANDTVDALASVGTAIEKLLAKQAAAKAKYDNDKFAEQKLKEEQEAKAAAALAAAGNTPPVGTTPSSGSLPGYVVVGGSIIPINNNLPIKKTKEPSYKDKLRQMGILFNSGGLVPKYMNMGGVVPKYFAAGGYGKGTDTIPAMLTPGEFVVRKSAVDSLGIDTMKSINKGELPSNNSVYNYSLSVNVSNSNANANEIARVVMNQIKQVDSQRIRGSR